MAAFFSQIGYKSTAEWKEEIVFFDPGADKDDLTRAAVFPDGTPARLDSGREDPREVFADWLLRPENPWFSRNIANRVWSWLLGRGIVHEPDDIRARQSAVQSGAAGLSGAGARRHALRPEAPLPADPELADLPALVDPGPGHARGGGQLRALPAAAAGGRGADRRAEPDHRAPRSPTAARSRSRSPSSPRTCAAIALPTAASPAPSWSCSDGRRATPAWSRSATIAPTAAQRLHLLNSSHVQHKIKACPLVTGAAQLAGRIRGELAATLYLTILSRPPDGGGVGGDREPCILVLLRQPHAGRRIWPGR